MRSRARGADVRIPEVVLELITRLLKQNCATQIPVSGQSIQAGPTWVERAGGVWEAEGPTGAPRLHPVHGRLYSAAARANRRLTWARLFGHCCYTRRPWILAQRDAVLSRVQGRTRATPCWSLSLTCGGVWGP